MAKQIVCALVLASLIVPLAGCVVYAPPPHGPGAVWVPGHYNGYRWVPGHWA